MSNRDFKLEKTNQNVEAILSEVRRLLKELGPPIVSKVNIEDITKEKMIGGHIGVATWLRRRNGDFVFVNIGKCQTNG